MKKLSFILLGLWMSMPIVSQANEHPRALLSSLIVKADPIDYGAHPAEYTRHVVHALAKAKKQFTNAVSTDEQLNIARLELQVALDGLVVDLQKATILDLQDLVKAGRLSYTQLTQMYLDRIELYDVHTTKLNSVRMLNPQALAEARKCDEAFRANPSVAKGMFGMPILIKDNINVVGMPTTAGSVALADNYAPYDAPLVAKLKAAGAVIIGKLNLTEFANYIATGMTTGFSSLGGQVLNPYRPVPLLGDSLTVRPSGSSAGSGVAAAAALAAITVGTETSGSILSPSFANSIVGIKPTVGLISRYGVIPISSTQDTAGPMGRNLTDAAILLNVLMGYDPHDDATKGIAEAGLGAVDYTQSLHLGDVRGKRIGLVGIPPEDNPAYEAFQQAMQALKNAGAEIITKPDGRALTYFNPDDSDANPPFPSNSLVLDYDFAKDLPAYLATLDANYPIKSLQHIVDFNREYMKTDSTAFPFGQAIMIRCSVLDLEEKKEQFLADRQKDILYARDNGIDYLLKEYRLDCIVSTNRTGSTTLIGAKAGYPTVSIPLANSGGAAHPINLHFTGTAFSEAQLIACAYVVEQATDFRIPPGLAQKNSLGAALVAAQQLPAEKRAVFQKIYDAALEAYYHNFSAQIDVDKAEEALRAALGNV
ncbi:MAG: amidase family protein [Bacteroidales bacterium]|nr:amidase family protein [Bacteroidales bacterium]MCL2739524.1 amidase family protein [Bacteroidales bacterium]